MRFCILVGGSCGSSAIIFINLRDAIGTNTPVEWNSCLDCESVILFSFHRNRSSTVSFIRWPCDNERLTMSWTNCQLKIRLVHIKHPCKMKVKDQNYQLHHDLYLRNFARLEKFYYVHAFQLPSLS